MTTEMTVPSREATSLTPVLADAATGTFFAGTRRGEFLLLQRISTGKYLAPQTCLWDPEEPGLRWVPASGRATVVSWTTVYGRDPERRTIPERVLGVVELEEGPWWWTELLTDAAEPEDLIGRAATVRFIKSGDAENHQFIPVFAVL
jgi:uncharacterized protein